MTKEQIAMWGAIAWLVLSGVSAIAVGVCKVVPNPPAWLNGLAYWAGVLSVDVHKLTGGDQ